MLLGANKLLFFLPRLRLNLKCITKLICISLLAIDIYDIFCDIQVFFFFFYYCTFSKASFILLRQCRNFFKINSLIFMSNIKNNEF